jgi:hypothetical protein
LAAGDAVFGDHDEFAGKTSRSYSARSRSKAQVSLAKTMVSGRRVADAAHGERAEAARIARGEDAVAGHHDDGECAFDLASESAMASTSVPALGVRDELHDDFGVGGGLEVSAVAFEAGAEVAEVDQVAVVRDGDEALGGVDADGLGVEQRRVAGGGVAGVADGHVAGQLGEHVVGEDFGDQAHALDVRRSLGRRRRRCRPDSCPRCCRA